MPGGAPSSLPAIGAASFTSGEAFEALPPGDLIMTLDAGTLVNQTIPAALANQPEEKAKFDKELAEMQEKSGVDPKQLKLMAASIAFPQGAAGNPEFAAIVTGSFDTAKLEETLKTEKDGKKVITQTYGEHTLYVREEKGDQIAISVLDSSAIVIGSPVMSVQKAIDARAGKADNAAKNTELLNAFKATNETSLARFAMKMPKDMMNAQAGPNANDPMVKSFLATNYLFGSVNTTAGVGIDLVARTSSPEEAQPLHDSLMNLLNMVKGFAQQTKEGQEFAELLSTISVTTEAADVRLKIDIPPDMVAKLAQTASAMQGAAGGAGAPMPPPAEMPGGETPPDDDDDEN